MTLWQLKPQNKEVILMLFEEHNEATVEVTTTAHCDKMGCDA